MSDFTESWWHAEDDIYTQSLVISPSVREHLWSYRQHRLWRREAGGQLFGGIGAERIDVTHVTGPYREDERGRCHYRSHPERAQAAIDDQSAKGRFYLGEWHTHPEKRARPSREDESTFHALLTRSTLRASALILLIQGTAGSEGGLAVFSSAGNRLCQWVLIRECPAVDLEPPSACNALAP